MLLSEIEFKTTNRSLQKIYSALSVATKDNIEKHKGSGLDDIDPLINSAVEKVTGHIIFCVFMLGATIHLQLSAIERYINAVNSNNGYGLNKEDVEFIAEMVSLAEDAVFTRLMRDWESFPIVNKRGS